jgi:hypothetical protein
MRLPRDDILEAVRRNLIKHIVELVRERDEDTSSRSSALVIAVFE